jgi:hypothetical protein
MADLAGPVNRAGGAGQGTQAVIRKHSHDLPIGLSHGPRDGSVVSSHCMNGPNRRVTWQATSDDENS